MGEHCANNHKLFIPRFPKRFGNAVAEHLLLSKENIHLYNIYYMHMYVTYICNIYKIKFISTHVKGYKIG